VLVSATLITDITQQGCLLHFGRVQIQWGEGPSGKSSEKMSKRKILLWIGFGRPEGAAPRLYQSTLRCRPNRERCISPWILVYCPVGRKEGFLLPWQQLSQ